MNMHVMKILDQTGHSTVSWDPGDPAEVAAARIQFEAMTDKGYRAFRIVDGDRQGAQVRMPTFDASAGEIIFVPQLKGG